MNTNPLVSIIIDNFNYGRFLDAAIASALAQTYPSTEVIVVDNGSTDGSQEIIRGYGSRVIAVMQESGTQASAFNAGFARSRGDVVIFLDSDDILLPATAGLVAKRFEAMPEIVKLQYRLEVIDEAGMPTGIIKPPWQAQMPRGDLRRQALAFPYDLVWMATSGNAFSARVLRRIMPIPEQLYGAVGADWYLSHLVLLYGPVDYLQEVGAYYRVHGSNRYEISSPHVDLGQVRQTIVFMDKTNECLQRFAVRLDLRPRPRAARDILSVSFVANRLISLKLDPERHPLAGDRAWRLFLLGAKASLGRFDVSPAMRGVFLLWFAGMALAPRSVAARLARVLLFPGSGGLEGRLLGILRGRRVTPRRAGYRLPKLAGQDG